MEINRTYDVPLDGFEFESATLRVPGEPVIGSEPVRRGGLRDKVDHYRRIGLDRLRGWQRAIGDRSSTLRRSSIDHMHSLQRSMSDRAESIRCSIDTKVNDLKPVVRERAESLKNDIKTNPGKWAGIAAGAGLAIGIGGRIMRHRMHDRMPEFVIIETTC